MLLHVNKVSHIIILESINKNTQSAQIAKDKGKDKNATYTPV